MKKILVIAALLCSTLAFAQGEKPAHFKLYGFIRNYLTLDTREVTAGTQDLYFYMPKDISLNAEGVDLNSNFNWRYLSLTTRLGLDVSGYHIGSTKISGKVEADFYSLNGTATSNTIAQLRLRQAFIKLGWDCAAGFDNISLTLGQAWHPMAVDMPHMTNLETGAPFNPFSRTPQIMADFKVGSLVITASVMYLNHFLPVGPNGKSVEYYKYGIPEAYLGLAYINPVITLKAGVDLMNTRPYRTMSKGDTTVPAHGFMTAISPFLYVQYTTPNKMFQLRAKTILAQSGEQMNLLSGYGVAKLDWEKATYTYTPMRDWASFLSFQWGKKFQVMAMAGYMKQLGTTQQLMDPENAFWTNTAGGKDAAGQCAVQQAFRVTPTVAWNIGKFTVSLEYNYTRAQFGDKGEKRGEWGLYEKTHWADNHRFICMTKFTF